MSEPTVQPGVRTDGAQYETTLDPGRQVHVGLWRDEAVEPHARFFSWDVPPLTTAQRAALSAGRSGAGPGLSLERVTDLLESAYLPTETGIARADDDALCVAVWTPFPGATPSMLDWWMGWHMTHTDRYKLWHPQAHCFAQARYDYAAVTDLDDRARYVGNTSWVDEYVGPVLARLAITFDDPAVLGMTSTGAEGGTVLVGRVADSDSGAELAYLVHAVRPTPYGCEMRNRFYFPPGLPPELGPAMLDHCATEMAHLATFLPRLHALVTGAGPHGAFGG